MNKQAILQLCNQIISATEGIVSIGVDATRLNAAQLLGIRQSASQIVQEVGKPEKEDEQNG